jgi:hypothetical protein
MNRQLPVTPNHQKTSSNSLLGVTGSFLVIWSYWKFSGHGELLEVFWSFGVTGSFLDIGTNDQKTSSNSLCPDNFQ